MDRQGSQTTYLRENLNANLLPSLPLAKRFPWRSVFPRPPYASAGAGSTLLVTPHYNGGRFNAGPLIFIEFDSFV